MMIAYKHVGGMNPDDEKAIVDALINVFGRAVASRKEDESMKQFSAFQRGGMHIQVEERGYKLDRSATIVQRVTWKARNTVGLMTIHETTYTLTYVEKVGEGHRRVFVEGTLVTAGHQKGTCRANIRV